MNKVIIEIVTETSKIIASWTEASIDLEIKIITHFTHKFANDLSLTFPVFVPYFGSNYGTVIQLDYDKIIGDIIVKDGFGFSTLGHSYYKYNRTLFIETLEDWGFWGPKELIPKWYRHRNF